MFSSRWREQDYVSGIDEPKPSFAKLYIAFFTKKFYCNRGVSRPGFRGWHFSTSFPVFCTTRDSSELAEQLQSRAQTSSPPSHTASATSKIAEKFSKKVSVKKFTLPVTFVLYNVQCSYLICTFRESSTCRQCQCWPPFDHDLENHNFFHIAHYDIGNSFTQLEQELQNVTGMLLQNEVTSQGLYSISVLF